MKKETCPLCGYKPNPQLWECARVECPNRKPEMWVPGNTDSTGYEPGPGGEGTYVRKPKLSN